MTQLGKTKDDDGYVIVNGEGTHYNIENLLLDPLIVGILMLDRNHCSPEDLGLGIGRTVSTIDLSSTTELQTIADNVLAKIKPADVSSDEKQECHYIGGFNLFLPTWFLQMNGHLLEDIYKDAFPKLKSYHQDHMLERDIVTKIVADYISILPQEFVETLEAVANI